MKKFIYSLILILGFVSCVEMDLEPIGLLDKPALYGSENGVLKYFAGIYDFLPVEDFNYRPESGFRWGNYWENHRNLSSMSAEMIGVYSSLSGAGGFNYIDNNTNRNPYLRIRLINEFIRDFPDYKGEFGTEAVYKALLGEAHVLRAFFYFALVKRYGGVPIVKDLLLPTDPLEETQYPRSKEVEVYKFIAEDLDLAISLLPANAEYVRGRIDYYVAQSLMSRAMLYAGSTAKYGKYAGFTGEAVNQGLVGIPESEAEWFFQKSYDASKVIIQSGKYRLYTGNADKVQNYVDMILEFTYEDILVKEYREGSPHEPRLRHSFDVTHSNNPDMSSDNNANNYANYDMLKLYEELPLNDAAGKPIRYSNIDDVYKNLEPRALANFYFPGMSLRGVTFDVQRGLYLTFPGTAADANFGNSSATVNATSNRILQGARNGGAYKYTDDIEYRVAGRHGTWNDGNSDNALTGLYIRKMIDYRRPTEKVLLYVSDQPFKLFRYAEILLNCAEAAYELGLLKNNAVLKQEAFTYISDIRTRAGSKVVDLYKSTPDDLSALYLYPYDSNMKSIRDERQRELLFENHRWWDYRRWRSAEYEFNQYMPKALFAYRVLNENVIDKTGASVKPYIYLEEWDMRSRRFNFDKRYYYEQIPTGEFAKNPNLYPQNPNY